MRELQMKILAGIILFAMLAPSAIQASARGREIVAAPVAIRSHIIASVAQAGAPASSTAAEPNPATAQKEVTAYTLPPDLYKKAHDLGVIHFRFNLIGFFYGLVVLWIILRFGLSPKYRDWAEKVSRNSFVQTLVFAPLDRKSVV